MMAQSAAAATPSATAAATARAEAAPAVQSSAFNATSAVPFSRALKALVAGAGAAPAQVAGGAAVPDAHPAGGQALPVDLLQALIPHEAASGASSPEARNSAARNGGDDQGAVGDTSRKADQASALAVVPTLDPGAALLAAVLHWLQQQGALAPRGVPAAESAGTGIHAVADSADVRAMAASAAAVTADAGGNALAGTRAAVAPGVDATATAVAAPAAALSGQLADRRDPDTRGAAGQQSATADNGATATLMDMAAALRAATTASPNPVERSVAVPVHERHWPQALAAQVLILSNERVQAATLRLSPEHLGPVEVHINLQDAYVNVTFTAAHMETRAALEQAMPQLRAVLAGAGLTLGQATVQQQARRESQSSNAAPRAAGDAGEATGALTATARALGMVDEYV